MTTKDELERQRVINAAWDVAIEHAAQTVEEHARWFASENGNSADFDRCVRAVRKLKRGTT